MNSESPDTTDETAAADAAPPAAPEAPPGAGAPPARKSGSGLKTFAIVFGAIFLAIVLGAWAVKTWLFPSQFSPVELRDKEKVELNDKLHALGYQEDAFSDVDAQGNLTPQKYSEAGASREVRFSERELNALLAKNSDLAQKFALDLSDNLASARMVIPVPEDFPFLAGQTVRMSGGVQLSFEDGRPSVIIQGVSVWGVPIPNAWLGGLKNVDLVAAFGGDGGFWSSFAEGIEKIEVRDGQLFVKLQE